VNILVIGIGNPSRGDDALGPMLVEAIEALRLPGVETLSDFQLQIEYVLDLYGRDLVVFADASLKARAPYEYTPIQARATHDYTSHALPPEAVLAAYVAHHGEAHPPACVLAMRGERFELGEGLSSAAATNLAAASRFLGDTLRDLVGKGMTPTTG
jgi:hydrogenase maturation protease